MCGELQQTNVQSMFTTGYLRGVCTALFTKDLEEISSENLPNKHVLKPSHPHPSHVLLHGALLYNSGLQDGKGFACHECLRYLSNEKLPLLALANNMWIGEVLRELAILNLAERILVARTIPCCYLIKLFPKAENLHLWAKDDAMYYKMRGNVSTHPLNNDHIAGLVSSEVLPPQARVLAAVIGITFVAPKGMKLPGLPRELHIRRRRVHEALLWLKHNNPLYKNVIISDTLLNQLPLDGVPEELLATV